MLGPKEKLLKYRSDIEDFVKKEKLILHPRKVSFHPISSGIKFTGYQIKHGRIYAGKRIKLSFQKFVDTIEKVDLSDPLLTKQNKDAIMSKYFSRT